MTSWEKMKSLTHDTFLPAHYMQSMFQQTATDSTRRSNGGRVCRGVPPTLHVQLLEQEQLEIKSFEPVMFISFLLLGWFSHKSIMWVVYVYSGDWGRLQRINPLSPCSILGTRSSYHIETRQFKTVFAA